VETVSRADPHRRGKVSSSQPAGALPGNALEQVITQAKAFDMPGER
jgi:hypothetical protein